MKNRFNPEERKRYIIGFICLIILIYIIQLFNLQVINRNYKESADSNAFLKRTRYPSRGVIYDRNGKLLVYNQPAYDVMIVVRETQPFDTLAFCKIVNISIEQFRKNLATLKDRSKNPGYSPYTPQTFLTQLGNKEYGMLQEALYKFPGFEIQNRTVRQYNYPNAAQVLGYIAPADKKNIADDPYYVQGDFVGKSGVERRYETYLRGEKGVEILLRDAHGRIKGKYEEGIHDVSSVSGKDLTLAIDMELQAYGEKLMKNKLGSIVMIEPETGEILCLVSSPSYDPELLVGRQFSESYRKLIRNPYKPLFNRALNGTYPPGSTFKTAQGLVFLQEDIITPNTAYTCSGGWPIGFQGRPKCHAHGSPLTLVPAIGTSCNAYFCWGLKAMLDNKKYGSISNALSVWKDYMVAQGFGYRLGVDLPGESPGFIPNSKYYSDHLRTKNWKAHNVISIAIGQGEINTTPLQICNLAATIANRGYFITPHVVRKIQDNSLDSIYTHRRYTGIDQKNYQVIAEGMRQAVVGGTCGKANLPDIEVCGKTGTAQNIGHDHSNFMGFAPMDHPKVAIAVLVENGGFGATYAVPIGRLMLEKYLKGEISEASKWYEDDMINKSPFLMRNDN